MIQFRSFRHHAALLALAFTALLAAPAARAHPLDESRSDITVSGKNISWELLVGRNYLKNLDQDHNGALDPAELAAGVPVVQDFIRQRLLVNANGQLCTPAITGVNASRASIRAQISIEYRCPAPIRSLRIEMHLFDGISRTWTSLAVLEWGDRVLQYAFRDGNAAWDVGSSAATQSGSPPRAGGLAGGGLAAQAGSFLTLGIEHIFTGYDHLLFLIGLLLLGGRFWALFRIITAFTVAHSVTLILAALGVVSLPARVIEPAIALSIAYVGAENFFLRSVDRRWMIAFAFGLIHGFGFASILREMGLPKEGLVISLLAFNVGVELGQLAVVAVTLPIILLVRRQPWHRWAVSAASIAIVGMGLYWFVTRVAG